MRREPFVIECYFWKDGDAWVGHSMSFDLRVDALNLEEARLRLGENITIYVDEALASQPSEQARLLKVKAPLSLQLSLKVRF